MDDVPEIPVLDEHSPAASFQEAVQHLQEVVMTSSRSPPFADPGLSAAMPAAGGAAPADAEAAVGRRWSLDASSVHSDWELLSHGGHSHCGSSPHSVSASEGYNSDAGEHATRGASAAAPPGASYPAVQHPEAEEAAAAAGDALPLDAPQRSGEAEGQHPELQPFGSLVVAAEGSLATAAAEGEHGSVPSSTASTPRSSYDGASSHASGHDLYSLSQDGSVDALSDHDSYIEDMMVAGEPDIDHSAHSGSTQHDSATLAAGDAELALGAAGPAIKPHHALHGLSLLAAAPGGTLAVAARGVYVVASTRLRALAASFGAYLARIVPAGADVAHRFVRSVASSVADAFDTLKACVSLPPQGLGQLASGAADAAARAKSAAHSMRKGLRLSERVNWAKVALALGGACGIMAVLLLRARGESARLAAQLARREGEFSSLLMRIAELQRNISAYQAHSRVPIIRHVSATAASMAGGSSCVASWPAVVVV